MPSRAECFIFEFTTIICFTFHLAHAFFLDKCSKCLLCLVFENRRRSFILYQTFWIFDLESNVVIVIISIIVIFIIIIIIIILSYQCYYYRFQVNILPRGLIPHRYTILCPKHRLERTDVCMCVFHLPSIIKK